MFQVAPCPRAPKARCASFRSVSLIQGLFLALIFGLVTVLINLLELLHQRIDLLVGEIVLILELVFAVLDVLEVLLSALALVNANHHNGVQEEDSGHAEANHEAGDRGGGESFLDKVSA